MCWNLIWERDSSDRWSSHHNNGSTSLFFPLYIGVGGLSVLQTKWLLRQRAGPKRESIPELEDPGRHDDQISLEVGVDQKYCSIPMQENAVVTKLIKLWF
jgi:hypothetical protein